MSRRIAGLLVALSVLGTAVAAHAEEPSDAWFDNGTVHFQVPDGVVVSTRTVRAPEGPVEVVFVRPTGAIDGTSFVALTIFTSTLPGDGEQSGIARDIIVDGVRSALAGARISTQERPISLDGVRTEGIQLSIGVDGANANATAGAVASDGVVVVYYDQRTQNDAALFGTLDTVGETFGFGPAPATTEPEPVNAPATE